MGFWSAIGSAFKSIGPVIALDALALALKSGDKKTNPDQLKDKAFRSEAYGTPWLRCRGVVRCQGKDLWGTRIQTSWWKTVSGGLFGLGSESVTYPKYSASRLIGFGKHLNGGTAVSILRLWADGKILYNSVASNGVITGAVTVTVVGGGQLTGSQTLQIDLASGASVVINAGDLLSVPGDPAGPYTSQTSVTASGPTTLTIPIWPPLRVDLAGGSQVTMQQVSGSPYDLSSFDPNPHDGSHPTSGPGGLNYLCPPGGVRFYLGSDTQLPDPLIVNGNTAGVVGLGAGNVPGYRGLVMVLIHDLQLVNYGDHFPAITAEVAYDIASPLYPNVGPVTGADLVYASLSPEFIALPSSGVGALNWFNPLTQNLQDVWVFSQTGQDALNDGTIYRVNTQTNMIEDSELIPRIGTFRLTAAGMVADAEGMLYFVQNNTQLTQIDGMSLNVKNTWGNFPANVVSLYPWDTLQSCFGNNVLIKLLEASNVIVNPQTIRFFDRTVLLPLGVPNSGSSENVVIAYTNKGTPIVTLGDETFVFTNGANNMQYTDDSQGNLWVISGSTLTKIDCQFISSIDLSSTIPQQILALPTFATTDIDVSTLTGGGSNPSIQYYPGDNTIAVIGLHKGGKVDCATNAIVQTVTWTYANQVKMSQIYDPMGGLIVATGGTPSMVRIDLSSMTEVNTYDLSNFVPGGTGIPLGGYAVYDPYSDSVWYDAQNNGGSFGGFNRAFLDRGNGNGIGLDSIVSTLMLEAGYQSSEFDVTQLTASGKTCYGVEFERETFLDSLRKLMKLYTFDAAEIDGKIHFVPRGNSPIVSIPEDDLGALDDPTNYESRDDLMLTDERDIPQKVTIKYYDPLKDSQAATQEMKRTVSMYPSSLSSAKVDTASRQEFDITSPITEYATPVKQLADILLREGVASRFSHKFKLPPKYIRYDPTDVVTVNLQSRAYDVRLTECDFGSGMAREMTGVSQDVDVYTSTVVAAPGFGSGSSTPSVTPTPTPAPSTVTYTISPTYPLSDASPTEIDMAQVTATWSDGRTTVYSARTGGTGFAVSDPGAGNTQLYYVNIYDPNRLGETPGTPSLTTYCDISPTLVHLGQSGYVFMGTITITHDGVGVVVTSGGSQNINQATGFYVNGGGGSTYSSQIDVLHAMALDPSLRATKHLHGSAANNGGSNIYSYIDTATHSIAQIKTSSGNPWDILLYDNSYIYQLITELDDAAYRDWSVATSYKKFYSISLGFPLNDCVPTMPRYFKPGGPSVTIDIPTTVPYHRYRSCSIIDSINRPIQKNITTYISGMNFDNMGTTVGNLGVCDVIVNERYAGKARERMYYAYSRTLALWVGWVKWDMATLVSGSMVTGQYQITNWSVRNQLVSGGGVTPNFPCGYGVGWP